MSFPSKEHLSLEQGYALALVPGKTQAFSVWFPPKISLKKKVSSPENIRNHWFRWSELLGAATVPSEWGICHEERARDPRHQYSCWYLCVLEGRTAGKSQQWSEQPPTMNAGLQTVSISDIIFKSQSRAESTSV